MPRRAQQVGAQLGEARAVLGHVEGAVVGDRVATAPSARLTRTARSSMRSRDSVGCVTSKPSLDSILRSSVCEVTTCVATRSVIRACRRAWAGRRGASCGQRLLVTAPAMAATNGARSSLVMMSGGARRIRSGRAGLTMKPASSAAAANAGATDCSSWTPRRRPRPSTATTPGRPVRSAASWSPTALICGRSGSKDPQDRQRRACASGFPPNVEPCMPG